MPAIAEALTKAGYVPVEKRLADAVQAALDGAGGNYERALTALSLVVSADPALCWEAFKSYRTAALGALLREGAGRASHAPAAISRPPARSTPLPAGEGLERDDSPGSIAPPSRQTQAGADALSRVATASALDMRTDLDKPYGDCTKAELEAMARRDRRRGWFAEAMARPMPPVGVARVYFSPQAADELWRKADLANTTEMQT